MKPTDKRELIPFPKKEESPLLYPKTKRKL